VGCAGTVSLATQLRLRGQNGQVEIYCHWHTLDDTEPALRERLPAQTVDQLTDAIRFAALQHGDQRRPTGVPYLEHLLEALEVLVAGAGVTDPDVLTAAVLHDVIEDTSCTGAMIAERFGSRVAELVRWVTIPEPGPGEDRWTVKQASLRRLAQAPRDAILVKLADRVSNVQTLRNLAEDRQRTYYAQTVTYIIPLAADEPWFKSWYQTWQAEHADLAAPPAPPT
jgi:guanosine-3',5'-bis(diphosphate) 3'-pyrophosphohydrolase